MSRNQKATTLASGFYVLAFAFFLWGAMVSQETRVTGTIGKRQIDIPVYLQNEPDYAGLKNTKVYPGWGGGRLLLWGVLGLGSALTGLVLSNERRAELAKERIKYKVECHELDQQARLDAAYRVSLDKQMKERTGEAALTVLEDKLEAEVDANREINGWYAPERPEPPRQLPAPQLRNEPIVPPPNSPEDLKAQLEALAAAARDRLNSNEGDRPESDRPDSTAADGSYQLYRERGEKVMRSLASLKMSILSVAPTGGGKTHTLYRWLGDLQALYPQNEVYVIAHKRDSFLGLLEQGRVTVFDDLNPEKSLAYLDRVYAEMKKRLDEPEGDRKKFEKMPIRLILDDWFATFDVLKKNYPNVWQIVSTKLGAIITKGREANVCVYIATQSFNLVSLGIQDSNIRGNLAITCQGLVTEKLDDYGELVEQGNYETLQLIISNKFIVSSKEDRERLNVELEKLIALSRLHQVPAMFCAVGKNTLAMAPYYEKPISGSTNVAVIDRNNGDDQGYDSPKIESDLNSERDRLEMLFNSDSASNTSYSDTRNDADDDSDGFGSDNAQDYETASLSANYQNNQLNQDNQNNQEYLPDYDEADLEYLKWLPKESKLIEILEQAAPEFSLSNIVRSRLKVTSAQNAKRAKRAIMALVKKLNRADLWVKFGMDDINI